MKANKPMIRYILIAVIFTGLMTGGWTAFCGYQWSWGPFARLHDIKTAGLPGNSGQYDLANVRRLTSSPLEGKHILFLGSSVTYGAAAQGVSFADYIALRNGCTMTKEAVSGTTLVDEGFGSYISRLCKLDVPHADLLVCQLSTNDATQKKELGSVSESFDRADFDTKTIAGAIEWIISYTRETWDCPVVFYTNPRYESGEYAAMVELLHRIQQKWNITLMDLWSDTQFNSITPQQQVLYMADRIHPTKAGYLEWWTPYMEPILYQVVEET